LKDRKLELLKRYASFFSNLDIFRIPFVLTMFTKCALFSHVKWEFIITYPAPIGNTTRTIVPTVFKKTTSSSTFLDGVCNRFQVVMVQSVFGKSVAHVSLEIVTSHRHIGGGGGDSDSLGTPPHPLWWFTISSLYRESYAYPLLKKECST